MSGRFSPLLVILVSLAACGVCTGTGVPLSRATFQPLVSGSPHLWLVEYMSPRCGTCKEMEPVWSEFVAKHGGRVKFGQVNIDDQDGMALAQDHGVLEEGIPSIWAFDRASGAGTKVWGAFEVPTAGELEEIIFTNFLKDAVKGVTGLLAKTK
eukprot:CAMPEP_0181364874 /NCGR_PEP_ID=MMETSP1106-20121128/9697_1 /TAXON_ID=81844 /ORGANISM="Mantoniella antarctica, Strain SL-175" /LENGTH=152 /DNA_ID=CAMNT_0023479773 /DNA_START=77 /DNA_END=535 /DNA_ORIENTATION=+